MYKQVKITTATSSDSTDSDSKYTVAQILSTMTSSAREAPITPISFSSGVAPTFPTSSSANLLTPTTFATLEQTLDLAIQSGNNNTTNQASAAAATESGFVPPVVNPIVIDPAMGVKREYDPSWDDELSSCSSTDPEYNPNTGKRLKTEKSLVPHIDPNTYLMPNSRRPTGPRKERRNEMLPPDEIEKRQVRRDRNKQAAAKCRQRRVDQTNTLINETENLEEEKAELETEIHNLQKQREELQFLLEAHKPACKHNQHITQASLQQHHHQQQQQMVSLPSSVSYSMPRPSTLPLRTTQAAAAATTAAPISVTTPSSGMSFSHLGLDALIDGHTGLTPITTGPPPPSCSSQVQQHQQQQHHRTSTDSSNSSSSPNAAQLISL